MRRLQHLLLAVALIAATVAPAQAGAYEDFFNAVRHDQWYQIQRLLERGFDPNTIDAERGETGLILALREDHPRAAEVLLKAAGLNPEIKARNGDTALMLAAYTGNKPAVEALLNIDAEVNRPGWTALHYAAAAGADEIVRLLLDHFAYIDAESPNRTTPLMMAARGGHILTVKLLLDEGADATLKNDQGLSAIDLAKKFEHTDIVEGLTYRMQHPAPAAIRPAPAD
ncbi:MAG: ankyrin repeat domain-containing protein [Pseudomonadota bacterium]|nr:ankyrin repeat domain-containing protein [Pseudomonadota bacterium]